MPNLEFAEDNAFDVAAFTEATPEKIAELTGLAESLANDFVEIKRLGTELNVDFQYEGDQIDERLVRPTELLVQRKANEVTVIGFCNQKSGAFINLRLPKDGPPVLTDYYPDLTQAVLDETTIKQLGNDDTKTSKTASLIFEKIKIITERVNAAREAGIVLNDDYTGPEIEPNPDGTVTVEGDQIGAFMDGLPNNELDGLLDSSDEATTIRQAVIDLLDSDPNAITSGNGLFSRTFKDDSTVFIGAVKAQINSTDADNCKQFNDYHDEAGLSRISVDYEDESFDYNIEIPFGDKPPAIVIVDKRLRQIAVDNAIARNETPLHFEFQSNAGSVSGSLETTDPAFAASHAVRVAEHRANGATATKVNKSIEILNLIRQKLSETAATTN